MITLERTVGWSGDMNSENLGRVTREIVRLHLANAIAPITLCIYSGGGDIGAAFAFYDFIRNVSGISINTIGLGQVSSAAVVAFMAGTLRLITPHTTMLIHEGERGFGQSTKRAVEMRSSIKSLNIWDEHYHDVLTSGTQCSINLDGFRKLAADNTVLTAEEILEFGIATGIMR
ncbi:MAG: ATP-dependent Clp protease proteolytic subunit [Minisyncoccia bacterium]